MPSISFLGTGPGLPLADRFFSSTVLHLGEVHLLIDVGEPCVHLLRDRSGLIEEIEAVLITHGHVDHIGGLPALLQGCMLLGRRKPLSIYLPEETIPPVRAWISALYLTEKGLGFPLNWKAWRNGEAEVIAEGVSVTPHANKHLEKCYRSLPGADPGRPCASYSLEIVAGDFRAIFSGDLAQAEELASLFFPPSKTTTVLVSELSHFSLRELGAVLRKASLDNLCLVHLSQEYAEDRSQLQLEMEELLPNLREVFLPADRSVLDF